MKDDYNCNVLISTEEWNLKRNQTSTEICNYDVQNKERISKSFTHICESNKFFLSLIKLVFLYLKNYTDLSNNLTIIQIREIPTIIYHTAKHIFAPK